MSTTVPARRTTADSGANEAAARLQDTCLATEIEFLTARARAIGSAHANRLLAPLGLKVRSYSVLALAVSDQAPSQRELADFLRLDPSQVVALVDELEKRKAIARRPDPRDRRSKSITATAAGRRLYAKAKDAVSEAEGEALGALSDEERDLLRSLLTRVAFAQLD